MYIEGMGVLKAPAEAASVLSPGLCNGSVANTAQLPPVPCCVFHSAGQI